MNLFAFIDRGVAQSGVSQRIKKQAAQRQTQEAARLAAVVQKTRNQWLNAILVDQIRGWSDLGEKQSEIVLGMCITLTMAGMCEVFDKKRDDMPSVRVIRGALSAAAQCKESRDYVLTADDLRAFGAAAAMAKEILERCSDAAICHASQYMHNMVEA